MTDPPQLHAIASALSGRLLGVDAGGSGTRVVVLEGGQVTPQPDGPPMNANRPLGIRQVIPRSASTVRSPLRYEAPTAPRDSGVAIARAYCTPRW